MVTVGKTTLGYDWHFFAKPTITDVAFPASPQVFVNLNRPCFVCTIQLISGTSVQYSFNGDTIHGDLVTATGPTLVTFTNKAVSKIFFLAPSSSVVRVEAWVAAF